jgi:hypothetical protein
MIFARGGRISKRAVGGGQKLAPTHAEFLGCFFMRLPGQRNKGGSTNNSAALYFTVTRKQAVKIDFLMGS